MSASLRRWTDEEYGLVMDSDLPLDDLADRLGRTRMAVQGIRNKLRRGWVPAKQAPWSEEEDSTILAHPAMRAETLAAKLGRTTSSVHQRRHKLKADGVLARRRYGDNDSPFRCGSRPMLAKTCPACGLLLQAKWFMQDGQRKAWSRNCRRCAERPTQSRRDRVRADGANDALQKMTLPGAVNHNKPWLEADMKVLSDPDMTRLEKALELGRTYHSVCNAVRQFEFPSKVGLGDPERDQWMIDNPNAERLDEIRAQFESITDRVDLVEPELLAIGAPKRPDFEWDD